MEDKETTGNEERVKTKDGTMLVEKEAVKEGYNEHFEVLLNVEEDRKIEIQAVGSEDGVKVFGKLPGSHIVLR